MITLKLVPLRCRQHFSFRGHRITNRRGCAPLSTFAGSSLGFSGHLWQAVYRCGKEAEDVYIQVRLLNVLDYTPLITKGEFDARLG